MLLTIINNLFVVFILHIYNRNLFGLKTGINYQYFIGWIMVAFCFSLQSVFQIQIPAVNMLFVVVPYVVITLLLYKATLRKTLIYTLYFYSCAVMCEVFCFFGLKAVLHIENGTAFNRCVELVSNLVVFILIRIFLLLRTKDEMDLGLVHLLETFIVPVGSIYLINYSFDSSADRISTNDIISTVIILLFNVTSYYFYTKMQENMQLDYKAAVLEQKNADYIRECERVTELWKRINEFQHDLKYFPETEKNRYLKMLEMSGFKKNISRSGCVIVDAIINSKASYAADLGIEFSANVRIVMDQQYMSDDISILLYNLIDNAIEANQNVTGKKYIDLTIKSDTRNEETLLITIKNPYDGMAKKNNYGDYITRKKDRYVHGIGLRSVEQIVNKHNGQIKIEDKDNLFCVRIIIFNMSE